MITDPLTTESRNELERARVLWGLPRLSAEEAATAAEEVRWALDTSIEVQSVEVAQGAIHRFDGLAMQAPDAAVPLMALVERVRARFNLRH